MAKDILKSIKKCDVIFSNGQDVLVGGVHLWLFRADGEFVKKVLPIRWPYISGLLAISIWPELVISA